MTMIQSYFGLRMAEELYYMRRDAAMRMMYKLCFMAAFAQTPLLIGDPALGWPLDMLERIAMYVRVYQAMLVGVVFWCAQRWFRRRAWRIIAIDYDAYAVRWREVSRGNVNVLEDIEVATQDVQRNIDAFTITTGSVKVIDSCPVSAEVSDVCRRVLATGAGVQARACLRQVLPSLPLLYIQATSLQDYFQEKCDVWAAGCGKHVDPGVKRPRRAIQKMWRTYQGNARFVTDLVRSCIVCDRLEVLLDLFDRIRRDPTVAIVRIKNRLSLSYDSSLSGGYRNLALNLVVVDDYTRQRCLETHVCELQLELSAMHALKSEGGHQRFISFRDSRAE